MSSPQAEHSLLCLVDLCLVFISQENPHVTILVDVLSLDLLVIALLRDLLSSTCLLLMYCSRLYCFNKQLLFNSVLFLMWYKSLLDVVQFINE